jgi:hypothetical protein
MNPAEIYAINFQNSEPRYYSRIPHILSYLTYDDVNEETGEVTVKNLSLQARELYRVIKSVAGEDGACWQTRDHLAELCNMSTGSITKAKEELQKPFHQLDGNPLIKIEERKKKSETNGTCYHIITIIDIWKWNGAFMATKKYLNPKIDKKLIETEAPSPHDRAEPAPSPHDGAPQGARSPHDGNKNTINKNPLFKEQQPASSDASVCSLNSLSSCLPSESSEIESGKTRAINWFKKQGFDLRAAIYFTENFSLEDIAKASKYVEIQINKKKNSNKFMENIYGYFRKTIENKWWQPKKA